MFGSGSYEEEVAGVEGVPPAIMGEHSSTPNDEINLILSVGRLPGGAQGKGKGYIQRATPKDDDCVLARWDTRLSLDKTDNTAAI
jgi:hypothetical protein